MTGKGAFFGEAALMSTEPRVATVRATAAGDCYVLTKVSTALSDTLLMGCSDELLSFMLTKADLYACLERFPGRPGPPGTVTCA
jgi:CRP-like cAMP-binding protein